MITPPPDLRKSLHHWYRPVIAYPEGALVHDGDCDVYTPGAICTCGLLHALRRLSDTETQQWYPTWDKDIMGHLCALNALRPVD